MTGARYEIRRSKVGRRRWRVRLIGANGEPLSVSEHLTSHAACLINIAAQRGCVDAPMVEA